MAQEEQHKHPAILRYFDEIVPIERDAINARRAAIRHRRKGFQRGDIGEPRALPGPKSGSRRDEVPAFPYPADDGPKEDDTDDVRKGGNRAPDARRTRPRPEPRDLTGLALSGGGIRSAAVCLGALQALEVHDAIDGLDYLSTVSGGGYIGASLTVAMSAPSPPDEPPPEFPFQRRVQGWSDPRDTAAVGHIRNYSNYLLPRATPGVWNISEAAVILLRGILANAVIVGATLLFFAMLTKHAYPRSETLWLGSFIPRLVGFDTFPFLVTLVGVLALVAVLISWVLWRSAYMWYASSAVQDHQARLPSDRDVASPLLKLATMLVIVTIVLAVLDLQPFLLVGLRRFYEWAQASHFGPKPLSAVLVSVTSFFTAVAALSGKLGQFLVERT